MNILFLTDNFPPEVNAPAHRTYEHCREWVKQGANVTVITCVPNFPQGEVYKGYKNKWRQEEQIDGIRVIRVWSYIAANERFIKRILDFVSFGVMAFFHGLFIKTDLIVATSPQFFTALSGHFLSFFKRKPWIMEVRDLWPESIKAVGIMKDKDWSYRFLQWLERRMYRSAQQVVVVTDTFKSHISKMGIPKEKIKVVKNGVDLSKVPQSNQIKGTENLLPELKNKFVVGYIGTHGMAHGLGFILNCATDERLSEHIHFLFIGDGAQKKRLVKKYNSLQMTNVTMIDPIPKTEVYKYISLLDISLVNLKKSDTFKTVIPSKIFENAAMQKPILLGVEGESKAIIEQYNAGLAFEPENQEDFIKQLSKLYHDEQLYQDCQKGCLQLAMDFDRINLAQKMLVYLKAALGYDTPVTQSSKS
ncbi:MAG: glycosyltransferase family 4 protein [Bacteroidota bacterium]